MRAILNFFKEGVMLMPKNVNSTAIVLILKKNDLIDLKDFLPISLHNVIFKVVSKCLLNRLRAILEDIISPTQSAFNPGQLIIDNAFIDLECIHVIWSNSWEQASFCAYKLDMAQACDRVYQRFLEGAMAMLGFHHLWMWWVMQCVTTIRYSVHLSGQSLDIFTPQWGLR